MRRILLVIGFSSLLYACSTPKNDIIVGIQPYESFSLSLMDSINVSIQEIYGINTIVLPSKNLPRSAFIHVKSPRYRADSILRIQHRNKADTLNYILGLCTSDISFTKRDKNGEIKLPTYKYADWGIFGLGMRPGDACVVSSYRIASTNDAQFIERLRKVVIHELGHNFGLKHCSTHPKCVMRSAAETVKTIDYVDLKLCDACKSKIRFR